MNTANHPPPNPLPCGCRAELAPGDEANWPLFVVHCPLHAAAGDLRDLCRRAADICETYGCGITLRADIAAAITRIEEPT